MDSIVGLLRQALAWLCQPIYQLLSYLYSLFFNIANLNFLTNDEIGEIYRRVQVILTVVMTFYVLFQFVKYVVDPDAMVDKEKGVGKMAGKMCLVIVLLAFTPTLFDLAFTVQKSVLNSEIISKVILGKRWCYDESTNTSENGCSIDKSTQELGRSFAVNVLSTFYHVDNPNYSCDGEKCEYIVSYNLGKLLTTGKVTSLHVGLNSKEDGNLGGYFISFDGIFAVGVGGFICYILILYCVDVGKRVFQMAYLRIMAPIAIVGYISPKKDGGIFQKWWQQCITTYLDLFIRLILIYFGLFILELISKAYLNGNLFSGLGEIEDDFSKALIYIFLTLGFLMFLSKAPNLIKELFPVATNAASGNFGLKAKDRGWGKANLGTLGTIGRRTATGVVGAGLGGIVGMATGMFQGGRRGKFTKANGKQRSAFLGGSLGAVRGLVGGFVNGGIGGAKKGNVFKNIGDGINKQTQSNKRFGNRQEQGYGIGDVIGDAARSAVGARSRVEQQEYMKAPIVRQNELLNGAVELEKAMKERALSKLGDGTSGKKPETQVEAQKLAQKQNRVKDLEDSNSVASKSEFRVGRYTDGARGHAEYRDAVLLAESQVNRENFKKSDGTIDEEAYQNAKKAAARQVNKDDYVGVYKTQADADAAYEAALRAAEIDLADPERDSKAKAAGIDKDFYKVGFTSQAEADAARAKALDEARSELDNAEKAAVQAYIRYENDGHIATLLDQYNARVDNSGLSQEIIERDEDGNPITYRAILDGIRDSEGRINYSVLSDLVKTGAVRTTIDRNNLRTVEIDSEIERIKRQTDGTTSGDGGKK